MGRHIIIAFHSMFIVGLKFRHKMIQYVVKISSYIRVGIFVYSQTA